MLQFLLAQIGKIKTAISSLNSKTITSYGTISTNLTYAKCGNVVTVFFNGVTVADAQSWTLLVELPSALFPNYSVHYKSMDGTSIQITSSGIKHRGSASDVYGVVTYVVG